MKILNMVLPILMYQYRALDHPIWGRNMAPFPMPKIMFLPNSRQKKSQFDQKKNFFYPPTKSAGYSFGCIRPSIPSVRPSGFISQYLLVRFDSFLVQMISTMDSQYPISLVKIDPITLELLPLF